MYYVHMEMVANGAHVIMSDKEERVNPYTLFVAYKPSSQLAVLRTEL